jgi:hypothetical protein
MRQMQTLQAAAFRECGTVRGEKEEMKKKKKRVNKRRREETCSLPRQRTKLNGKPRETVFG